MIDHRIQGVVKVSSNSSGAIAIAPKPSRNTISESQLNTIVDFASTATWPPLPARTARIAVMGRIAIGPTMKTAVVTCRIEIRVSMPPSLATRHPASHRTFDP